jgi:hypothetical protein
VDLTELVHNINNIKVKWTRLVKFVIMSNKLQILENQVMEMSMKLAEIAGWLRVENFGQTRNLNCAEHAVNINLLETLISMIKFHIQTVESVLRQKCVTCITEDKKRVLEKLLTEPRRYARHHTPRRASCQRNNCCNIYK